MQEAHPLPYLREILLFLTLAGILIPVLQRLRVNQVLGFLAAGALVGPFGLGLLAADIPWLAYLSFPRLEGVLELAELGVLFLMFMIGLELSAERLWRLRAWVFGAGTAQVLLTAAVIGAIAWTFGNSIAAALVLGLVLSMSSTAVTMQLMVQQRTLATPMGQACFSILMLQDLAVVPLLILIGVLGGGQDEGWAGLLSLAMLKSAVVVALIYVVGRRMIRPLFHFFMKERQPEVFVALTLLVTLGTGALTALAGLSMALGALLAGLLLAETEFKHEMEITMEPFKGLLMGLFFMSVGMGIDVRAIAAAPVLVPLSVLGLLAIKATVIAAILRAGKLPWGQAWEGGLLLGQGGEFAFIVVAYAVSSRILSDANGQFILLVASLSMFATPLAARLGRSIGRSAEHSAASGLAGGQELESARDRVLIAGFGRVGQMLAGLLDQHGIAWAAFESDARHVASLRAAGLPVYFADATRADLLRKMDADQAPAIVLTMDHPASALHAVRALHRDFPAVPLFARSRDEKHARVLRQAGATIVVPETLESSLQLSGFVLEALGVPDAEVRASMQQARERFEQDLQRD